MTDGVQDDRPEKPKGTLPPRVRIAPSPTGDPHVGTAYIALFNRVFAKRYGGEFVLRIEDTDQARSTPASERAILEALRWLGLDWDEGPDVGGPHGPYRQSERLDLYRRAVNQLLESGAAYRCFCTRERLDALRAEQKAAKSRFGYDGHCRSVDPAEAAARAAAGEEHVIRLRVPDEGEVSVFNNVGGKGSSFGLQEVDDQVLLKSDGFPTYHLANVVDDHHMGITHVIRGEEWITSTPKHLLLYQAFGWEPPEFFHIGLLRNPDGSKLSKRKNPVSVFHYRDLGYLPSTFVNFLGNMGYSPPDEAERYSMERMIETFDWRRLRPGGPVFDPVKLAAFNADDMRAMSVDELYERIVERSLTSERLKRLLEHAQPRIERLDDFIPYVSAFFGAEVDYAQVQAKFRIKKRTKKEVTGILKTWIEEIERDPDARAFDAEGLEKFCRAFCERHEWKVREVFTLLRLASIGRTAAPPLFDTLAMLGKDRVRLRVRNAIEVIKADADWP